MDYFDLFAEGFAMVKNKNRKQIKFPLISS